MVTYIIMADQVIANQCDQMKIRTRAPIWAKKRQNAPQLLMLDKGSYTFPKNLPFYLVEEANIRQKAPILLNKQGRLSKK